MFLPISSATPQANPAALDARFAVVSISLKDCIINLMSYKPNCHLKISSREEEVLLDTY